MMNDTTIDATLLEKEARLITLLTGYGSLAVAYSGGVDSTYLADVAHEALGEKACMIIADSPSIPRAELKEATELAAARGWRLLTIETTEFENEEYLKNDGKRCYHCKAELFTKMRDYARELGVAVLSYGAILDDLQDTTRVGAVAAREHKVFAPLQEAGISKEDIRVLSRRRGLPTADKASFACLSSRFPKGMRVSVEAMRQVEQAEEALKALGFRQYRARHHGDICRVEVGADEVTRAVEPAVRESIVKAVRAAGFRFVTLDLAGYKTGSTA